MAGKTMATQECLQVHAIRSTKDRADHPTARKARIKTNDIPVRLENPCLKLTNFIFNNMQLTHTPERAFQMLVVFSRQIFTGQKQRPGVPHGETALDLAHCGNGFWLCGKLRPWRGQAMPWHAKNRLPDSPPPQSARYVKLR
jgi:hypothetical protein